MYTIIKIKVSLTVTINAIIILLLYFQSNNIAAQTIKIGQQEWMSENLNVTQFRNGDFILEAKNQEDWIRAAEGKIPAWCTVQIDSINTITTSKIYNWYAINDIRGLAPNGFHIPESQEWNILIKNASKENEPSKALKGRKCWITDKSIYLMMNASQNSEFDPNGTNVYGFNALPFGMRDNEGLFLSQGQIGYWWCKSEQNYEKAQTYMILAYPEMIIEGSELKSFGLPVRCLKNQE
jgi:uncharacterized protein (TIGR02145 family)